MTVYITLNCDANFCLNSIESDSSNSVKDLIDENAWHEDPTTQEYHYCDDCWPEVEAEYKELAEDKNNKEQ